MKIHLEVAKNKSMAWPWALRTLKKFPSHAVAHEDGLEIHSVDLKDTGEFSAVFSIVAGWKMVNVYVDGNLLSKADAHHLYWKERRKDDAIDALTRALRATTEDVRKRRPPDYA